MLSQKEPVLTDMMLRYPFVHHSRRFFDSIPIEESFSSREVVRQAEMRLMSALGRANYEPHVTELVEFSSFFVSAFVASQESLLAGRFAKREAERSRGLFEREDARDKAIVIRECFGIGIQYGGDSRYGYSAGVEEYLALVSKYELAKAQRWKLVRQALSAGRVYFTDNVVNDLFGDSAESDIGWSEELEESAVSKAACRAQVESPDIRPRPQNEDRAELQLHRRASEASDRGRET